MRSIVCFVFVVIFVFPMLDVRGAPIKLDFDHTTAITETGWTNIDSEDRYDLGAQVDLGDGVSSGISAWSVVETRDRGQSAGHPAEFRDLLRDMISKFNWVSGNQPDFSVRGLAAGRYTVTVISGDHDYPSGNVDLLVLNATTWTATSTHDMALVNLGDTVSDLADVSSTVEVTIAAGEALGLLTTDNDGRVAGMVIELIPPPTGTIVAIM